MKSKIRVWERLRGLLMSRKRASAPHDPVSEEIERVAREVERERKTIRLYRAQHIVEGGQPRGNR
jgi:hypothetical protein